MAHTASKTHYRPLCHTVALDNQDVSIIDQNEAIVRADEFLQLARDLMQSSNSNHQQITEYLLDATDLGSAEAPYVMALRILAKETVDDFFAEEAILFLKLAAERGHQEACYRMACCYQGSQSFPQILTAGASYFAELSAEERKLLAKYYFAQSV